MRRMAFLLAGALACAGLAAQGPAAAPAASPDDAALAALAGHLVIARTSGGGDFQGYLFLVLPDRVELLDSEGRIVALARSALLSLESADGGRDPAEFFRDSASNRLIVMPTGFGMEKGEFHVAAQEIAVITSSYGISPSLSVWGGVSIPGGVLNLRWSTPIGEGAAISLGSFLGTTWMEPIYALLPYAIASFGHPNDNITVGAGIPLAWGQGEAMRPVGLVGAIGGKFIVSASASIVTENWIMAWSDGWTWESLDMLLLPSAVFRIAGGRLSWDIGATVPLSVSNEGGVVIKGLAGDTMIPIPLLSVTYRID